jgi:hypothetical protein
MYVGRRDDATGSESPHVQPERRRAGAAVVDECHWTDAATVFEVSDIEDRGFGGRITRIAAFIPRPGAPLVVIGVAGHVVPAFGMYHEAAGDCLI